MRVSLSEYGDRIVQTFEAGGHYPVKLALGESGRVYVMRYSTDEDGGHGVLTLVPVKVEVVVPQQIDVRV